MLTYQKTDLLTEVCQFADAHMDWDRDGTSPTGVSFWLHENEDPSVGMFGQTLTVNCPTVEALETWVIANWPTIRAKIADAWGLEDGDFFDIDIVVEEAKKEKDNA